MSVGTFVSLVFLIKVVGRKTSLHVSKNSHIRFIVSTTYYNIHIIVNIVNVKVCVLLFEFKRTYLVAQWGFFLKLFDRIKNDVIVLYTF